MFDNVIHLGDVIATSVFILTLISLHRSNKAAIREAQGTAQTAAATLARMETKIEAIWAWWVQHRGAV